MTKLSVIAGKSSEELAARISRRIKRSNLVKSKVRVFADGESKITLGKNISREEAVIVQSIYPPVDTNLIQTLSLISKVSEETSKVVAVIPYMGYARQDREFLSGEIVTMKVLGRLFKGAGASKIIVVDIHSMTGLKHFAIKTENVTAIPYLAEYFSGLNLERTLVVSPDRGGEARAKEFARKIESEYIVLKKTRDRNTGEVKIKTKDAGQVAGRDLVLVDDMISTGGSIIKATEFLKRQKCCRVYVACTHALLVDCAEERIRKAGVTEIVSTNTIPGKTSIVDISAAIARVL